MRLNATQALLVLSWLAIGLLAMALSGVVRQVKLLETAVRLRGGGGAAIEPPARLLDSLRDIGTPQSLLLFVDASCPSCVHVLRALPELREDLPNLGLAVVPISGHIEQGRADIPVLQGLGSVLVEHYGVPAAPFGVVVDQAGRTLDRAALGSPEALDELVVLLKRGASHASVAG